MHCCDWLRIVTFGIAAIHPPSRPESILSTHCVLPSTVGQALLALAQVHGTSLGQVLTAAFALYQWRLSGVGDLIVGVTVTARSGSRMRRILGMVSNVAPLRLTLEPSMRWGELLKQLSRGMRGVHRHQRYNGEALRRDLGLRPDEPGLFGTVINHMSFDDDLTFSGHATGLRNLGNWWVKDLLIVFHEHREASEINIDFHGHPSHYSRASLATHLDRFVMLLQRLCDWDTARPLYQVDMLSSQERHQVLEAFNATGRTLPETTLVELFESQVARCPEATAVVQGETSLSYSELNGRANQLAHYLIGLGVGPESLVGVCLERSFELVVSLLGILKAGGAYVPLDPSYPPARLAFMITDTQMPLMLTQRALKDQLPETHARVVCLDTNIPQHTSTERHAVADGHSDQLAYLMYTSGSTG